MRRGNLSTIYNPRKEISYLKVSVLPLKYGKVAIENEGKLERAPNQIEDLTHHILFFPKNKLRMRV